MSLRIIERVGRTERGYNKVCVSHLLANGFLQVIFAGENSILRDRRPGKANAFQRVDRSVLREIGRSLKRVVHWKVPVCRQESEGVG